MAKTPDEIVNHILGKGKTTTKDPVNDILGKDKMMYSLPLRKKIDIPDKDIKVVKKGKRKFLVGKYEANGKKYTAWQATK